MIELQPRMTAVAPLLSARTRRCFAGLALIACASTAAAQTASLAEPTQDASATWAQLSSDGKASPAGATRAAVRNPKDPLEPWNRKVYAFNDAIDEAVLKPVATAYRKVVPEPARQVLGNFLGNFGDAWSTVNHFLQGKVQTGLEMMMRVSVNTVFGLGGLIDIGSDMGLERRDEDFGQTLGRWGVPAGPYLVWPLLGPSSLRETAAMPLDRGVGPGLAINDGGVVTGLTVLQIVDTRSKLLGASRLLDDVALDKYVFVRDAYLSRRRSQVYDGDPPPEPEEAEPPKRSFGQPAVVAAAQPDGAPETPRVADVRVADAGGASLQGSSTQQSPAPTLTTLRGTLVEPKESHVLPVKNMVMSYTDNPGGP